MKGVGSRTAATLAVAYLGLILPLSSVWAQQAPPLVRSDPYSDEELEEIRKLRQFERLYRWGAQVFRAIAEQVIERTYLNERAKIKKDFRTTLQESLKSSEVRRLEAIKEFEAWIKRHPDDKKWSPDVLYRLAELYYEKSTIDFQYAQARYQETIQRLRRRSKELGKDLPEPPEPQVDYLPSIALYRRIVREFPKYRNRDVVHYLMGYTLREMAKQNEGLAEGEMESPAAKKAQLYGDQARQAFLSLVCANRHKAQDPPVDPQPPPSGTGAAAGTGGGGAAGPEGRGRGGGAGGAGAAPALGAFDPYDGCKPILKLKLFSGDELKKRRALLSQAWFLLGEQHFDADPIVKLSEAEIDKLKQEFQKHRSKEQYLDEYQRALSQKKEVKIKVHNYYAISAYTRVVKEFSKSEEYSDAMYKRAWTFFRVNDYQKALDEFDKLLIRSKDVALRENAVRYVALCAYYQKVSEDKFGYLLNHYKNKGWLNDTPNQKYPHVKEAFHQLAKIYFEESAPPPDMPGRQNYRASDLLVSLKIYRWVLRKGGFGPDTDGKPDRDWKYFKGKAEIQKAIIQILFLLSINAEVSKKYPRKLYHKERRAAFNRFSPFPGSPHRAFAKEYQRRHGKDPQVQETLAYLSENSLTEIANEYYLLGRRAWAANEGKITATLKEIVGIIEKIVAMKSSGKGTPEQLAELKNQLAQKRQTLRQIASTYEKNFMDAAKAYDIIIGHAQFRDTFSAYQARYFKADCYFFTLRYLKAAKAYKAVADSKISNKYRLQALRSRVESLELNVQINIIPPSWPNPAKDTKLVKRSIPQSMLDWHRAMLDYLQVRPKTAQAVPYKFSIAYTYYQYGHAPKAKQALWTFLKDHCDTTQGFFASQALLTMALINNKGAGGTMQSLKELDGQRQRIAAVKCGTKVTFPPKTPKKQMEAYAKKVKTFYRKMLGLAADIRMNRADALYKAARRATGKDRERKYLAAAKELEDIARRNPKSPRAAISLYYAAEGYEETKRFRKAKQLYEEILKKPEWRKQIKTVKEEECKKVGGRERCKEVKKNRLDDVVSFLARAAWKAMEFKQAQSYYGQLAMGKVEIDDRSLKVYAYFWYARLLRIHGRTREAVKYFMKYYSDIPVVISRLRRKIAVTTDAKERKRLKAELADALRFKVEVFYQIGTIYKRLNDLGGMEKYYGQYIRQVKNRLRGRPTSTAGFYERKKNKDDKEAAYKMMRAQQILLDHYKKRRRARKIRDMENDIVDTFSRFHLPKGSAPASYAAAIAFKRIQPEFRRFMAQTLKIRKIRLRAKYSGKPKKMVALMCELMGWGQTRGRQCKGKALPMLQGLVNPYVAAVGRITQKFLRQVAAKYGSAKWNLAVRARMGQMYTKAAKDLDKLPLPPEVKKFWKIFWKFVQKYKKIPRMRTVFEKMLSKYEIDIDDDQLDMATILDNYKDKLYQVIRTNAKKLRDEATKHFTRGVRDARLWGISNEWTVMMRKGLSQLDSDRFPYVTNAKVAKD